VAENWIAIDTPSQIFDPRSNINVLQESNASTAKASEGVSVYCMNIQCLLARLPELSYHLEIQQPHVVCIQETWLDLSVKDVAIPGYILSVAVVIVMRALIEEAFSS